MKVVDVHAHIFPDEPAEAYMLNYSEHSGFQARCGPTLDALCESYEGVEVVNYVILQQWQTSVPFEEVASAFPERSSTGSRWRHSSGKWARRG
jgi:hypothetical protein